MSKRALLVGCNYPGTKVELHGCSNDVKRMQKTLIERFGFDQRDILVLLDTEKSGPQPTGANIRSSLGKLIKGSESGDVLVFHYSGHGTQVPQESGATDATGSEEAIVPTDMNLLTDDDFRDLVNQIPAGVTFYMISDSCHSGGLIDNETEQIGASHSASGGAGGGHTGGGTGGGAGAGTGGGNGGGAGFMGLLSQGLQAYAGGQGDGAPRSGLMGMVSQGLSAVGDKGVGDKGVGNKGVQTRDFEIPSQGGRQYERSDRDEEEGRQAVERGYGGEGVRHHKEEAYEGGRRTGEEGYRGERRYGGEGYGGEGVRTGEEGYRGERRHGEDGYGEEGRLRREEVYEGEGGRGYGEEDRGKGGRRHGEDGYGGGEGRVYGDEGYRGEGRSHGEEGYRGEWLSRTEGAYAEGYGNQQKRAEEGGYGGYEAGGYKSSQASYGHGHQEAGGYEGSRPIHDGGRYGEVGYGAAAPRQKSRNIPIESLTEILSQRSGQNVSVGNIRTTLFDMFGDQASPTVKMFMNVLLTQVQSGGGQGGGWMGTVSSLATQFLKAKLSGQSEDEAASYVAPAEQAGPPRPTRVDPDVGILLSGCQSDETSADANPSNNTAESYGAFSNAIQTVLAQTPSTISNRDLILEVRKVLAKQGFKQHPCLYCSNSNVESVFICET